MNRICLATFAMLASLLSQSLIAAPPEESRNGKPEITATFSIVAVDPDNHVCGAAVASKYPAVGKVVPYV